MSFVNRLYARMIAEPEVIGFGGRMLVRCPRYFLIGPESFAKSISYDGNIVVIECKFENEVEAGQLRLFKESLWLYNYLPLHWKIFPNGEILAVSN